MKYSCLILLELSLGHMLLEGETARHDRAVGSSSVLVHFSCTDLIDSRFPLCTACKCIVRL